MIKKFALLACLIALLSGCNSKDRFPPNLDKDYEMSGTAYNMTIYVDKDMPQQQKNLIWTAIQNHYLSFWFGITVIYLGPDKTMDFGDGNGPQVLVGKGQLVTISGSNPQQKRVNLVITNKAISGAGPMGPGLHYRAFTESADGDPTIMVRLDKDNSGGGGLDGLFTMLHYYYNEHRVPSAQKDYYSYWAQIFAADEMLSDAIRNSR